MINSNRNDSREYGFLTIVPDGRAGVFGGLLVLNGQGRPLEFHCTAPTKPNRVQEILYGPTLSEYLYGEQISQTLVNHASTSLAFIVTDSPEMLAVRRYVSHPVLWVRQEADSDSETNSLRIDSTHESMPKMAYQRLNDIEVAVPFEFQSDLEMIGKRIAPLGSSFDLLEPFDRIRDAIAEAQHAALSKSDAV